MTIVMIIVHFQTQQRFFMLFESFAEYEHAFTALGMLEQQRYRTTE
jgi:hypothetical protein